MTEQRLKSGTIGSTTNSTKQLRLLGVVDETTKADAGLVAMNIAGSSGTNLRLAYMTGQYPRATDTFIQREVATLRELGYHVQTFSVRKPPETENVGSETAAERSSTVYLLPPIGLFGSHFA